MGALHDMHCHLDFMANGEEVASEAAKYGTRLFANTVTPEGWLAASRRYARFHNVAVGFGMHPWWVGERSDSGDAVDASDAVSRQGASQRARRKSEAASFADGLAAVTEVERGRRDGVLALLAEHDPAIIGEIGLDFGWRHQQTRPAQMDMFSAIAVWLGQRGGKLVSLHSIRAASETLDVLEDSGAVESCTCVFHWFSGPSDVLKRAIADGCYFSCGPRMLATGKGREYVKAIPVERLLLETDDPPEQDMRYSYSELRARLESVAQSVAEIKGADALDVIEQTSLSLLA